MGIMTVEHTLLSRRMGGLTEETGCNYRPSNNQMSLPAAPKPRDFVQEALMLDYFAHMIVHDDDFPT